MSKTDEYLDDVDPSNPDHWIADGPTTEPQDTAEGGSSDD